MTTPATVVDVASFVVGNITEAELPLLPIVIAVAALNTFAVITVVFSKLNVDAELLIVPPFTAKFPDKVKLVIEGFASQLGASPDTSIDPAAAFASRVKVPFPVAYKISPATMPSGNVKGPEGIVSVEAVADCPLVIVIFPSNTAKD